MISVTFNFKRFLQYAHYRAEALPQAKMMLNAERTYAVYCQVTQP